jgi:hypothetical protein
MARNRIADEFQEVVIVHNLHMVGQCEEEAIYLIEFPAIQLKAQPLAAQPEGMKPGMLPSHQPRARDADGLRGHDFIGRWILDHAILVDSRLVRERIPADDGFVWLHWDTCNFG